MQPRFPQSDEIKHDDSVEPVMTGKRKKRQWFEERYGRENGTSREVKFRELCKFYASTGICRNGDRCKYSHESVVNTRINEPCKFLYDSPVSCRKGANCHFSHDLWKYPCPLALGGIEPRCPPSCGFQHDPILTETASMDFVRLYRVFLSTLLPDEINPRWKFYLEEEDESVGLARITRQSSSNLFNHQVGTLSSIPRIVLNS